MTAMSEGPARPARRWEGYDAARATMIQLAHGFAGLAPTERTAPWAAFDAFILGLANQGRKRGDIYHLLVDVENNEASQLVEESRDALYDYETGLIGHARRCPRSAAWARRASGPRPRSPGRATASGRTNGHGGVAV